MSEEKKDIPLHRQRLNLPDKEEATKLRENFRKQLAEDMRVTFNTPSGRRVLRYFMSICGYKRQKVGGNPAMGLDILHGTFYNAVREQVILEFIEVIPDAILKDVEFGVFEDLLEQ
jgi:hypothetical protein